MAKPRSSIQSRLRRWNSRYASSAVPSNVEASKPYGAKSAICVSFGLSRCFTRGAGAPQGMRNREWRP